MLDTKNQILFDPKTASSRTTLNRSVLQLNSVSLNNVQSLRVLCFLSNHEFGNLELDRLTPRPGFKKFDYSGNVK